MFKTMRELSLNLFYLLSLKAGLHTEMLPNKGQPSNQEWGDDAGCQILGSGRDRGDGGHIPCVRGKAASGV